MGSLPPCARHDPRVFAPPRQCAGREPALLVPVTPEREEGRKLPSSFHFVPALPRASHASPLFDHTAACRAPPRPLPHHRPGRTLVSRVCRPGGRPALGGKRSRLEDTS